MTIEFSLPGRSLLHRWDPRAKLAGLVIVLPAFFVFHSPWLPGCFAAALALVIWLCLGGRELAKSLAAIGPVLGVICLLTPIFRRAGQPVWSPWGVPLLTSEGIAEAVRMAGRFAGLTLAFIVVFRTLSADNLVLALRWYRLPFRGALALMLAFRFIPTLFALSQNVRDAHVLRRASETPTGFFARTMPQLTSVFIQAVRMIPSLAMALETRGLGRGTGRTEWMTLPKGRGVVCSFVVTALLAAAVYAPLAF